MIRVMLFLDPGGTTPLEDWQVLGRIDIHNDFMRSIETDGKRGNYSAAIYKKRKGRRVAKVKVRDFPRLSYHPWNLVREILNKAAEKNGGRL